jgi:hypothetical protein
MAADRRFEGLLSGCVHSLAALVVWMPLASSVAAGCCNRTGWAVGLLQPRSNQYHCITRRYGCILACRQHLGWPWNSGQWGGVQCCSTSQTLQRGKDGCTIWLLMQVDEISIAIQGALWS